MFFTAYVLCSFSLVKLKTERQTWPLTYRIKNKILANPGLA